MSTIHEGAGVYSPAIGVRQMVFLVLFLLVLAIPKNDRDKGTLSCRFSREIGSKTAQHKDCAPSAGWVEAVRRSACQRLFTSRFFFRSSAVTWLVTPSFGTSTFAVHKIAFKT